MPLSDPPPLTELLHAARDGDRDAFDRLFSRVYDELHRVARRVRRNGAEQTLGTTALVHEVYLKLVPDTLQDWQDREHFFRVAALAMRQVLLNAARARSAQKRGGGAIAVTLGDEVLATPMRAAELIALDAALERLGALDARAVQVVELRFFAGLSVEETARLMRISAPTVKREWRSARAWLLQKIRDDGA